MGDKPEKHSAEVCCAGGRLFRRVCGWRGRQGRGGGGGGGGVS